MTFRKACSWYHDPFPLDGLGPIAEGDEVSHGLCPVCSDLATLAHHTGSRRSWVLRLLADLIRLEGQVNQRRWGGVPVLSWWLRQRTEPVKPMTRAKHAQIQRIAGSPAAYRRLMRIATIPGPKRLRSGWSAHDVNTYIAGLLAERRADA